MDDMQLLKTVCTFSRLRMDNAALVVLRLTGNILIVGDIQRRLGVLPAAMSRLIKRLEIRGCIICSLNIVDRRKINVEITEKGIAEAEKFLKILRS